MVRRLHRYEPWLVLLAGPPLVFRERFPLWLQAAALAWIALLWAVRYAETGRLSARTALDAPIIALLLTLPGAITAAGQLSAAAISRAESLLFAVALYYALANAVHTPARLWSAISWTLIAGLGLSAVGMVSVDWIEKYPALTPFFERIPQIITGVPHPTLRPGTAPDMSQAQVHPNTLAALLVLFLLLALTVLLWPRRDETDADEADATETADPAAASLHPPRWLRPLALASVAVYTPLIVLTQSRGGWLAVTAGLVVLAGLYWRELLPLAALGGVVAALLFTALGPGTLVAQIEAGTFPGSTSLAGRIGLWRESAALLREAPLNGIGLNTFPVVHGTHPEYGMIYQGAPHAHNVLLQSALDYGIPGFVAVVGLYAAVAWAFWRVWRRLRGSPLEMAVVGLAVALAAHALHGTVDAVAIGSKTGFVVWAFTGILGGSRRFAHRWVSRPGHRASDPG